jgi:spore coat polysaccharide biosynthesis protein SpsF
MNFAVVINARLSSSRLPGKALLPLRHHTMLEWTIFNALSLTNNVCLATTHRPEDDFLADIAQKHLLRIYRGSTNNVLERTYEAGRTLNTENILRLTADNPITDIYEALNCIKIIGQFDLISNKSELSTKIPAGLGVELFSMSSLGRLSKSNSLTISEKEHINEAYYNRSSSYTRKILYPHKSYKIAEHTVDTLADYVQVKKRIESFEPDERDPKNFIMKYMRDLYENCDTST